MLRFVIGLCSILCLVSGAPTVHLGESHDTDTYEYRTELPFTTDPIVVTRRPLVSTSYVNPINMNNYPTITPTVQQPAQQLPQHPHQPQKPHLLHQPQPQQPQLQYFYTHFPLHPYTNPSYQMQPGFGYQWQDTIQQPQYPVLQPMNTNVLPCTHSAHNGGYQQFGY
ncbi:uncharacterized protein LOC134227393 [Armigeres subalbatus]|uniref:uncharacterized protein LOC134227393 n=1 Tax=Armigeres subalbatus TaxID=124917 RepID=UPI002ED526AB